MARQVADAILADPWAEDEWTEAMVLTLDEERWTAAKTAHRAAEYARTGQVKTGSIFDELEAETGGNVTPEAVEAFLARKQAEARHG